jgi:hypothetical protein
MLAGIYMCIVVIELFVQTKSHIMSHPSFDIDINGVKFTLAPICAEDGNCNQYSVMTDQYIFRMNQDNESGAFKMDDKHLLPEDIGSLEEYLSNAIRNNEQSSERA